jgi:hypothetical protein
MAFTTILALIVNDEILCIMYELPFSTSGTLVAIAFLGMRIIARLLYDVFAKLLTDH